MSGVRAAGAVRGSLVLLALLRLAGLLLPSMVLWGLNAGRFGPPLAAGLLWLAPAVALVPAVGRRLDAAVDALARGPLVRRGLMPPLLAGFAAAIVLALPDRVWFVGDYLLRESAMREPGDFLRMFPQAQPLDVLLHHRLPQFLLERGLDSTLAARLLGAAEAAALALLARRFAAGFGLDGARSFAVGSAVMAGGYLALFAGYAKPTLEVALAAVAIGTFGAEAVRGGRGLFAAVIAFALALALHRSALGLLPGVLAIAWLARRRDGARSHRAEHGAAVAVLALVLAGFLPRLWQLFGAFDLATNFTSHEVRSQGGPIAAAFSGLRLLDLANLVLLHVPLAVALPVLLAAPRVRAKGAGADARVLAMLAVLFAGHLPAVLFAYVTQGAFRDWDANAGGFAALALLVAAALARGLPVWSDARRTGLASAAALAAWAATLTLIVAQHDLEGSLRRARAFLAGPPARTESQRLATLDFLGLRALRLERFDVAADDFARLSADAPHPRALVLEGTAALLAGRDPQAKSAFARLLERDSTQAVAWMGLWMSAARTADTTLAAAAERRVMAYSDSGPEMGRILAHLEHYPGLWARMPRGRISAGSR